LLSPPTWRNCLPSRYHAAKRREVISRWVLTKQDLEKPSSPVYKYLESIAQHSDGETVITVKVCRTAHGEDGLVFIMLLAKITHSKVIAYDDWYAGSPHGTEWTAYPPGTPGYPYGGVSPGQIHDPYEGTSEQAIDQAIQRKYHTGSW